jgi:hypothetical protein
VALLVYLIVTGQAHTRDSLAALYYPDYDESHAKAALRRTLSALTTSLGQGYIQVAHELISIGSGPKIWADVIEFTRLIEEARQCSHHRQKDASARRSEICQVCRPWLEQGSGCITAISWFSRSETAQVLTSGNFQERRATARARKHAETLAYNASLDTDHEAIYMAAAG